MVAEVAKLPTEEGIVEIRGRRYKTVGKRVHEFREKHRIEEGWRIITTILDRTDDVVVMRAEILNPSGVIVATGHAEEKRVGAINLTSALENAETSAIGRALASSGLAGAEYGSAEELAQALELRERFMEARKERAEETLGEIVRMIDADDQYGAMEIWRELERDEQIGMWRSFNSHQKKWMRDAEQAVAKDKVEKLPPSEKDQRRIDVRAAKEGAK